MLYNPPTGAATANDSYLGKNVAGGTQGSKVPPGAVEFPQRELVAIILEALINPTNDDLKQVMRAIRSGRLWTFTDVSQVANTMVINPPTAHTAIFKGLPFRIFPAFSNDSSNVFLNVNGMVVPVTRRDGSALLPKDIQQNIPFDVCCDGAVFRLMNLAASEVPRTVANPIVYVRGITGNDQTGDGSADAAGKAFKTLDAALLAGTSRLNYSGSQLQVIMTEQTTHAAPQTAGSIGTTQSRLGSVGSVLIQGGNGVDNQDAYVISGTGYAGNTGIIHPSFGTNLVLKNLRADNQNPTGFNTITASSNATLAMQNVTLSGLNSSVGLASHLYAPDGGRIRILGGCKATSSMPALFRSLAGSITLTDIFKIIGALSFSNALLVSDTSGGSIQMPGGSFDVSNGSVTGQKYQINNNATLQTFGQGVGIIPGTIAGATSGNATAV